MMMDQVLPYSLITSDDVIYLETMTSPPIHLLVNRLCHAVVA